MICSQFYTLFLRDSEGSDLLGISVTTNRVKLVSHGGFLLTFRGGSKKVTHDNTGEGMREL